MFMGGILGYIRVGGLYTLIIGGLKFLWEVF